MLSQESLKERVCTSGQFYDQYFTRIVGKHLASDKVRTENGSSFRKRACCGLVLILIVNKCHWRRINLVKKLMSPKTLLCLVKIEYFSPQNNPYLLLRG